MKYIEEYTILGATYGISKASEWMDKKATGYKAWYGGGGIGDAPTINDCRKIIHSWATQEVQELLEKHKVGAAVAKDLLNWLGSDEFNLGIFRTLEKEECEKLKLDLPRRAMACRNTKKQTSKAQ